MSKKTRITDSQFKTGITIIVIFILASLYFSLSQDRFIVKEDQTENPLLQNHQRYETEFCANRLTELTNEIHFLEKEIESEKKLLGKEKLVQQQEKTVIKIEQQELQEVKKEFETYTQLCNQLDTNSTTKLCTQFLQEAKNDLETAQKNADTTTGLKHLNIISKDLRNSNRIYEGLQKFCANT